MIRWVDALRGKDKQFKKDLREWLIMAAIGLLIGLIIWLIWG
jgi:hypothetical protein